jgi:hypothetical protein
VRSAPSASLSSAPSATRAGTRVRCSAATRGQLAGAPPHPPIQPLFFATPAAPCAGLTLFLQQQAQTLLDSVINLYP